MLNKEVGMKRILVFIFVIFQFSAFSSDDQNQFFKNLNKNLGIYKVVEGSSPQCQGGKLAFTSKKSKDSFRLGHKISFGPTNNLESEKLKNGCSINYEYKFSPNKITEIINFSGCPKKDLIPNSTTKTFQIRKDSVQFQIPETKHTCIFKREL